MAYHINAKTGNPNVCRSASCELPHYETKEAALSAQAEPAPTPAAATPAEEPTAPAVPDEPKGEVPVGVAVLAELAAEEEEATAEAEKKGLVQGATDQAVALGKKARKQAKRAEAKVKEQELVRTIFDSLERLATVAPKHPLVKKGQKLLKKKKK